MRPSERNTVWFVRQTGSAESGAVPSGAMRGSAGYFAPDSIIRQVAGEALGLLGGGRAILLQLAHPLVAAGVAEHSAFQADPLARLLGTLTLIHTLVFGDRGEVQRTLRRFHAVHAPINGRLAHAAGRYPPGTLYDAQDPELKLWVYATLVDTALVAHQRFVAPLTLGQQRRFYDDTRVMARLLRIPDRVVPPTLKAFQRYTADMLTGDTLIVTETSRTLARDVLYPVGVGRVPQAAAALLRFVTAGLLPPRFRKAYRLPWGAGRRVLLGALGRVTRMLRPVVPAWVWQSPMSGNGLARIILWGATGYRQGRVGH